LDLPVEKGLNARSRAKDRIEQRSIEYHRRVRNGYLMLAKIEPQRIKKAQERIDRTVQRLRFKISREGSVRFLSHLNFAGSSPITIF